MNNSQSTEASNKNVVTIGIAGGSGSGKTTLAKALFEALGNSTNVTYLVHDDYYRDLSHLSVDERSKVNFDHPDSLETSLLMKHIQDLKKGMEIEVPKYSFTTHTRTKETTREVSKPIIIVEGILILTDEDLRKELDVSIFVDADCDVRLARRMERDIRERGRTTTQVLEQYFSTVRPMHAQWVEPSKRYADLIVPTNDHSIDVAVQALCNYLRVKSGIWSYSLNSKF